MPHRNPSAFLSYVRRDDENADGAIAHLRLAIGAEISLQTGEDFEIFFDREHVAWGQTWRQRVDESLDAATFLIPIITPAFFESEPCRHELAHFLVRERALGRRDLVLPIYYVWTPRMHSSSASEDALVCELASRQHADWRTLRLLKPRSRKVKEAIAVLAEQVRDTLAEGVVAAPHAALVEARLDLAPARVKAGRREGLDVPGGVSRGTHAGRPAESPGSPAAKPARGTLQHAIVSFLDAELCHHIGAHRRAAELLDELREGLPRTAARGGGRDAGRVLLDIADTCAALNRVAWDGHAVRAGRHRRAKPPPFYLRGMKDHVLGFYAVEGEALLKEPADDALRTLRQAMLADAQPAARAAERLAHRYSHRRGVATSALAAQPGSGPEAAASAASVDLYVRACLDGDRGAVAANVLAALTRAWLDVQLVEHRRSLPVGAMLARSESEIHGDDHLLRQAVALTTFAFAVCEGVPWLFASDRHERDAIQRDPARAKHDLDPSHAMWAARQVILLSLYRRAQAFRLMGDNRRAHDDLAKMQHAARITRSRLDAVAELDSGHARTRFLEHVVLLGERDIGELYSSDHDYMHALVHLMRADDYLRLLERSPTAYGAMPLLRERMCQSIARAFFEIGGMKRALKWYVRAWRALLDALNRGDAGADPRSRDIEMLESYLNDIKHEATVDKVALTSFVRPAVTTICDQEIPVEHAVTAAAILEGLARILTVMCLDAELASGCLRGAEAFDRNNLRVQTSLLRSEIAQGVRIDRPRVDPMECWDRAPSAVDQAIVAGEQLLLAGLVGKAVPPSGSDDGVASSLLHRYAAHADSIGLRSAVMHRYLTQPRSELTTSEQTVPAEHAYLEFVCLRRFGSFTPFMPRPAAVGATGGGYLVRLCRPPDADPGAGAGPQGVFNVLIDPGDGVVNNLYRVGLGIADIDLLIATHDHPEQLSALDAILSLHRQRREVRGEVDGPASSGSGEPAGSLLVLGNASVVQRYSGVNEVSVREISEPSVAGLPADLRITALPTTHRDLGGNDAIGCVLELVSDSTCSDRGLDHEHPARIAFMSDTATEAMGEPDAAGTALAPNETWRWALASDVVVAHVSDVSSGELRELAGLDTQVGGAVARFDRDVETLARHRGDDARVMQALYLIGDPTAHEPRERLEIGGARRPGGRDEHLHLHGLLAVARAMGDIAPRSPGCPRVLVVGELREQLGSFRGTIAQELNRHVLGEGLGGAAIAVTADVGLRVRVASMTAPGSVMCTTCSRDNDRLESECFHPPQDIQEICVKGDHEAMYWNCEAHTPGDGPAPVFVETMGGYDPFASGGRYHG